MNTSSGLNQTEKLAKNPVPIAALELSLLESLEGIIITIAANANATARVCSQNMALYKDKLVEKMSRIKPNAVTVR